MFWTLRITVLSLMWLDQNPSLLSNSALQHTLLMPVYFKGLKFLVRICTDLGLKDVQDYAQKLKKAEKAREMKQQVTKKF